MNTTDNHRLLGVSAGAPDGSAEILLKSALQEAEAAGAAVEIIRLADLELPSGIGDELPGDAWWYWDRLLESDGVVFSTPIITRTMDARLKSLVDFLLGPNADSAMVEKLLAAERRDEVETIPFRADERVLRPRVAGFLAVGGSLTPQWKSLALPLMHTLTQAMSIGVVDQAVFAGAGTPQSIVLDEEALERARLLGRRVSGQLGRGLDDAQYQGEAGACPMCHLSVVELHGADVICAACGSRGTLNADFTVRWTNLDTSVISMAERADHSDEIGQTAAEHAPHREYIQARAAEFAAYDRTIRPGCATV